jgi:hypothetical protein
MRSCGRFGPAIEGTTVERSSSRRSENRGSTLGSCQSPCSFAYAGEPQVVERDGVDGEDRAGRAELGAHVADGRAVGERHLGDALAVELHELPHHTVLSQHLGDREDHVGRGRAGRDRAGQLEPDDPRDQHRHRLAQHGCLGLDAADAPAEDAEAVDHRRVRVGADERVGVGDSVALHDDSGEVLDVDLVDDAGAGRDDLEVVEGGLAPPQELVALVVALVLELDVALERVGPAEHVGDHGVVDDQLGRRQRVDLGGVPAEIGHRLTHRGQVDDAGDAGKVLHDHPGRSELDLGVGLGVLVPGPEGADVLLGDVGAVLGAQQVLEQDLEAVRQIGAALDRVQTVDLVAVVADRERALGPERVLGAVHPASSLTDYLDIKISNHASVCQCACRLGIEPMPLVQHGPGPSCA